MSMALSHGGDERPGTRFAAVGRLLGRAAKLLMLGFLVSNLDLVRGDADPETGIRIMGVLQRLGLVSLCVGLSMIYQTPTRRLVLAVAILLLYGILLFTRPPDGGLDLTVPGRDLPAWIDRTLLPGMLYVNGPDGYDPEGIPSTLPAIAQGLLGALLIGPLRSARTYRELLRLVGLALLLVAGGFALGAVEPVSKSLWSPAFVLVSTGVTLLTALLLVSVKGRGGVLAAMMRGVLLPVGEGAILTYLLQEFGDAYLDDVPIDLATGHGALSRRMLAITVAAGFTAAIWTVTWVARRSGVVLRL
jgi:predicted acyltransferase